VERGAPEYVGGEAQCRTSRRGWIVEEDEVVHALVGEEARPFTELALARRKRAVEWVRETLRKGPGWVVGEDPADGGVGTLALVGGGDEEVCVAEDEWGGAPAGGESGGARGVANGEAGYDVTEDIVGEGDDAVHAVGSGVAAAAGERLDGVGWRQGNAPMILWKVSVILAMRGFGFGDYWLLNSK